MRSKMLANVSGYVLFLLIGFFVFSPFVGNAQNTFCEAEIN